MFLAVAPAANAADGGAGWITITNISITDASGNVFPTSASNVQLAVETTFRSVDEYEGQGILNVQQLRRRNELVPLDTVLPSTPGFDMQSGASFTGGVLGTFAASSYTNVFDSYAGASSGAVFSVVVPAKGSFSITGFLQSRAFSVGDPVGRVGQSATATTSIIISPLLINGEVFHGDSAAANDSTHTSYVESTAFTPFSFSFTNPFDLTMTTYVQSQVSIGLSNSAIAAIPEPGTYALLIAGLAVLGIRHRSLLTSGGKSA